MLKEHMQKQVQKLVQDHAQTKDQGMMGMIRKHPATVVWVTALVVIAGVLLTYERHVLWKIQEQSLWLDTPSFLKEMMVVPGGLRYVTSLSENLLDAVTAIPKITGAKSEVYSFGVEYGYVVGTEANIDTFVKGHGVKNPSKYRLQYKGGNVNGVDTTGSDENNRTAENDYRYISNVNCTSNVKILNTYSNGKGMVAEDHRNYDAYRLYTLVVTYKSDTDPNLDNKINARSYIRYYDANGKLRVFYNDYRNADDVTYYGGCMCSFNQVDKF